MMTRRKEPPMPVKVAVACSRPLFHLYPPAYRRQRGGEMLSHLENDFSEIYADSGIPALVLLLIQTALDLLNTGCSERVEEMEEAAEGRKMGIEVDPGLPEVLARFSLIFLTKNGHSEIKTLQVIAWTVLAVAVTGTAFAWGKGTMNLGSVEIFVLLLPVVLGILGILAFLRTRRSRR